MWKTLNTRGFLVFDLSAALVPPDFAAAQGVKMKHRSLGGKAALKSNHSGDLTKHLRWYTYYILYILYIYDMISYDIESTIWYAISENGVHNPKLAIYFNRQHHYEPVDGTGHLIFEQQNRLCGSIVHCYPVFEPHPDGWYHNRLISSIQYSSIPYNCHQSNVASR